MKISPFGSTTVYLFEMRLAIEHALHCSVIAQRQHLSIEISRINNIVSSRLNDLLFDNANIADKSCDRLCYRQRFVPFCFFFF